MQQRDEHGRPGGVAVNGADGAGDELRLHAADSGIGGVIAVLEEEEQVEAGQPDNEQQEEGDRARVVKRVIPGAGDAVDRALDGQGDALQSDGPAATTRRPGSDPSLRPGRGQRPR